VFAIQETNTLGQLEVDQSHRPLQFNGIKSTVIKSIVIKFVVSLLNMADTTSSTQELGEDVITLRVKDQTGDEMFFKVKKTTKMQKIFDAYAQRRGIQTTALRFVLDGERLAPDVTPKMLELEENDQIDVMLETVGGEGPINI